MTRFSLSRHNTQLNVFFFECLGIRDTGTNTNSLLGTRLNFEYLICLVITFYLAWKWKNLRFGIEHLGFDSWTEIVLQLLRSENQIKIQFYKNSNQSPSWNTLVISLICKNRVFQHIFFIIYDMLIFGYSFMKKRIVKLLFSMIVPRTTDMIIKRLYITYDYWMVTTINNTIYM